MKYSSNKCDGEKLKYNFKGLIQTYLKTFVRILVGGDCINILVYINSECFCITYHVLSNKELEKEMVTHSSTLAWKIPWTEKPGRLQSMGSLRVGHN